MAPHNRQPEGGGHNANNLGRTRQQTRRATANNVATNDSLLYKDPANDREALEGDESKAWWNGLVNEYDGFFEIKTWKVIKRNNAKLDHGNKPLTTKNVNKKR